MRICCKETACRYNLLGECQLAQATAAGEAGSDCVYFISAQPDSPGPS